MILIISLISSVEVNKVNPFFDLTAPFPLIFPSNVFIEFEVKLLAYPSKLSLSEGIATFVSALFPKFFNREAKNPPD